MKRLSLAEVEGRTIYSVEVGKDGDVLISFTAGAALEREFLYLRGSAWGGEPAIEDGMEFCKVGFGLGLVRAGLMNQLEYDTMMHQWDETNRAIRRESELKTYEMLKAKYGP